MIVLQGLIYPPLVLISIGIVFLRLANWKRLSPLLKPDRALYGFAYLCLV